MELAESCFVFGVWIATIVAALILVETYGSRYVPVGDDIHATIPTVVPSFADALRASWDQHNEHRVPISRMMLWAILNATDFNLKVVMDVNVVLYGLFALMMILAAKKIRGRIAFTDAFFPLIALCWSQATNFLFAWQLQLAVALLLTGILLAVVASNASLLSSTSSIVASMCLMLLPLSGANGAVMVPALAGWLAFHGILIWRGEKERGTWRAPALLGSALASLAIVAVYLVGLQRAEDVVHGRVIEHPSFKDYARSGLELIGSALGPPLYESLDDPNVRGTIEREYWSGAIMLPVLGIGLAGLVYTARRRPREWIRTLGLGLFMFSQWCVIAAITWGRAPFGPGVAAADRYYTFLAPLLCCSYLVWVSGRSSLGRFMQVALLLFAGGVFAGNIKRLEWVKYFREVGSGPIEKFISEKRTAPEVGQFWASTFASGDPDYFDSFYAPRFQMLKDARLGPYRFLAEVPPLRSVPYPLDRQPYALHNATWNSGVCETLNDDAWIVLWLPEPRFVYTIRFTYRYDSPSFKDQFEMWWRLGDDEVFNDQRHAVYGLLAGTQDRTVTVIVNEKIDQFRIRPANQPCRFRVSKIELLVPASTVDDKPKAPEKSGGL